MPQPSAENSPGSPQYIDEINLPDLFGRLAKRWIMIATVTILFTLFGLSLIMLSQPSHLAKMTVLPPEYQDLVAVMEYGDIELTPEGAFKFSLFKMGQADLQLESLEARAGLLGPEHETSAGSLAKFVRRINISEEMEAGRVTAASVSFTHHNPEYAVAVIEDVVQRAAASARDSMRQKYYSVLDSRISFLERKLQQAAKMEQGQLIDSPAGLSEAAAQEYSGANEQNPSARALEQITTSAKLERNVLMETRADDTQAFRALIPDQITLAKDRVGLLKKAIFVAGYFLLGLTLGSLSALLLDAHARRRERT